MKNAITLILVVFLAASFSFAKDGRKVSVTIYNNDLAVVKDIRFLNLNQGSFNLEYQDVAARIDPTSVHFKSLTAPDKVIVGEQNFDYDLASPDKILSKYLGKNIVLHTKQEGEFSGELINFQGGFIVMRVDNGGIKMISRSDITSIDFPDLPEGLLTKPTLVWRIFCEQSGNHETELSYMTSGMQWHAEYIAVSKENDSKLELNAWVSIENNCGATFPDAKIKLIAGEIHRAEPERRYRPQMDYLEKSIAAAPPEFEEKSFFEYHLYTLNQPSTLKDNQIKQITLFPTVKTRSKKIYTYEPYVSDKDVQVKLVFKNEKSAGIGIPLPAGKVRIYKQDPDDNSLELIGEDKIDHTPKDEEVRLKVGTAFDVVAERERIERKSTGKRSRQETYQVKIRNHKPDENIEVQVIERFYNYWEIKNSSHRYKKLNSQKVQFSVPVMRDSEAILTFTVKLSW